MWLPLGQEVRSTFSRGPYTYTVASPEPSDAGETEQFVLRRGEKELLRTGLDGLSASVAVVWNEETTAFAVTWSRGGSIGDFVTKVFALRNDQVTELPGPAKTFKEFQKRHHCPVRGENQQAFAWDRATGGLVMVYSVYPTGDCGLQGGYTEGYLIDPHTGSDLRRFTRQQLAAYMKHHPQD
ncbi:MAG: hypothetical protein HOQ35_12230 [Acidobacteriaceae bacterium]|nr:hypothetical protein [Acidobacteriaceae bacterium]